MTEISGGDSLDFWRVLLADKKEKRLLLYAEMKLPGEAWLEFKIVENVLCQTATFRPLGLWGRLYWFAVLPFHGFIFKGMINNIAASISEGMFLRVFLSRKFTSTTLRLCAVYFSVL